MIETFCYGTDILLGNIYVKATRIHRQTSKCYILSIYIVAICNAIIHIIHTDNSKTSARLCIHERHPKPRPHGRAMGCLPWDVQSKMTAIYRKHSVYLGDKSYFPFLRREHSCPNRRKQTHCKHAKTFSRRNVHYDSLSPESEILLWMKMLIMVKEMLYRMGSTT